MSEPPNTAHGRLLEALHISGYSFTRACDKLEWLLEADRWKQCISGDDFGEFAKTIRLESPKFDEAAAVRRKKLAQRFAELGASQRQTAKALGVNEITVARDLGKDRGATDVARGVLTPLEQERLDNFGATDVAHPASGEKVAELDRKRRERKGRDDKIALDRAKAEQAARDAGLRREVTVGDVRGWRPEGVDAIVTDPPYITDDAVELHSALADFALDVLPEGGPMLVMTWQPILPAVLEAMARPNLIYRWAIAWTYETTGRTPDRARRVFDGWKPVLVFHKGSMPEESTYVYDVVRSENLDKESHEWGQSIEGFRRLIRAASEPGQTICDPFVGGGTTAVAALAEARHFTGCDRDPKAVSTTLERIAA